MFWCPDFLWRYKAILTDIRKHYTVRERKHSLLSLSWLPHRQGQMRLSTAGETRSSPPLTRVTGFATLYKCKKTIEKIHICVIMQPYKIRIY